MFYILGDLEGDYSGLAANYLDTYIESFWAPPGSTGVMRVEVQDSLNIPNGTTNGTSPANRLNTENRDVGGCSGQMAADAVSYSECYWGGRYINDKDYNTAAIFNAGNKNTWHKIAVHLKMNTISGGLAQADGIARIWLDDVMVLDKTAVVYRTGQHPTEKWKQFVISPYIGDGSPVSQKFWVDNLVIRDSAPGTGAMQPNAPAGISVN